MYHYRILQSSLSYAGDTIPSVPVGFHSHFTEHDRPSTSNVCPDNTSSSPKRFGDEEANLGINIDVLTRNKQFLDPLKCSKNTELRFVVDMDTFFIIYFFRQFSSSSQLFKITFDTCNFEMVCMLFLLEKLRPFKLIYI